MTTLSKIFLACSVIGYVAGGIVDFCHVTTNPVWTVVLPVGAIFSGVFFVTLVLDKEMALFDAKESKRLELARTARQRLAGENKS